MKWTVLTVDQIVDRCYIESRIQKTLAENRTDITCAACN